MNPNIKCTTKTTDDSTGDKKYYNIRLNSCIDFRYLDALIRDDMTYPIIANAISSWGSYGKSIVKFVRNKAVKVSDFWNQTANRRKKVAPQTAPKKPRQ